MIVCKHIPPAPGCHFGPEPCSRNPASSAQLCPPSVDRNRAASSAPAYTVSGSSSEGSKCQIRLTPKDEVYRHTIGGFRGRRHTRTCSPPPPKSCRHHLSAASSARTIRSSAMRTRGLGLPETLSYDKFPAAKMRAAHFPFFALSIRRKNKSAFARTD